MEVGCQFPDDVPCLIDSPVAVVVPKPCFDFACFGYHDRVLLRTIDNLMPATLMIVEQYFLPRLLSEYFTFSVLPSRRSPGGKELGTPFHSRINYAVPNRQMCRMAVK